MTPPAPSAPTRDDYALLYAGIRDYYAQVFWHWPGGATLSEGAYVLNYSGYRSLSGANHLWLDDPATFGPPLLSHAAAFFRQYRADWSLIILPEAQRSLQHQAYQQGCFLRWQSPLMVLDHPPRLAPSSITVQPLRSADLLAQAQDILGEAFQMDAALSQQIVQARQLNAARLCHYLAYWEARPAAIATLSYAPGYAGIWNVGTRRRYRRRGLASALMGRLCQDASAAGWTRSLLLASYMGQPLYEKMGYRVVGALSYLGYPVY